MTQPDSIPAEWIQAVGLTHCRVTNGAQCPVACAACRNDALEYITILRPLIEAETRERCAVMLDTIAAWLPKEALTELRAAMLARGE